MATPRSRKRVRVEQQINEEGDSVENIEETIETKISDPFTGETATVVEETRTRRVVDMPGEQTPEELRDARSFFAERPSADFDTRRMPTACPSV